MRLEWFIFDTVLLILSLSRFHNYFLIFLGLDWINALLFHHDLTLLSNLRLFWRRFNNTSFNSLLYFFVYFRIILRDFLDRLNISETFSTKNIWFWRFLIFEKLIILNFGIFILFLLRNFFKNGIFLSFMSRFSFNFIFLFNVIDTDVKKLFFL